MRTGSEGALGNSLSLPRGGMLLLFLAMWAWSSFVILWGTHLWLLFGILVVPVLIWGFGRPVLFFYLLILSLPFESALTIDVGFTLRLEIFFLVALIIALLFRGELHLKGTGIDRPLLLFLGIATVVTIGQMLYKGPQEGTVHESLALRGSSIRSLFELAFLLLYVSALYLTYYCCNSFDRMRHFRTLLLSASVGVACVGIYQQLAILYGWPGADITNALNSPANTYLLGSYGSESMFMDDSGKGYFLMRPRATFIEPLNLGHFLVMCLPFAIGPILAKTAERRRLKVSGTPNVLVLWVSSLLMAVALLLTSSRGAWIGFAIGLMSMILVCYRTSPLRGMSMLLVGIAVVIFSYSLLDVSPGGWSFSEYMRARFSDFWEHISAWGGSGEFRSVYWQHAIEVWLEHPITGVGVGNYALIAAQKYNYPWVVSAQSMLLSVLVDTGIIGFVPFVVFWYALFRRLYRELTLEQSGPYAGLMYGLWGSSIGGFVQSLSFGDFRFSFYGWVIMGAGLAMCRLLRERRLAREPVPIAASNRNQPSSGPAGARHISPPIQVAVK